MTDAIAAQLRAAGLPVPGEKPAKRVPASRHATQAPAAAPAPAEAPRVAPARNLRVQPVGVTAAPVAPAVVPVRWARAGGLFSEQHVGAFRVVLVGPVSQWPAVEKLLNELLSKLT